MYRHCIVYDSCIVYVACLHLLNASSKDISENCLGSTWQWLLCHQFLGVFSRSECVCTIFAGSRTPPSIDGNAPRNLGLNWALLRSQPRNSTPGFFKGAMPSRVNVLCWIVRNTQDFPETSLGVAPSILQAIFFSDLRALLRQMHQCRMPCTKTSRLRSQEPQPQLYVYTYYTVYIVYYVYIYTV